MLNVARRELWSYFSTPLAYIFLVVFLAAAGAATFYFGDFIERRQADLAPFFQFHPWLFLVLIPAVGMRLWAEERRYGTIELLMTLPMTPGQAVLGKFLAAWSFVALGLLLTLPIWITVNYLGNPDNGVIAAGYLASLLMAGSLLAAAACLSATTTSQVIAFVLGVMVGLLLMVSGLDLVLNIFTGWAPTYLVDLVASFSLITHFEELARGVLDAQAIIFFVSIIALFLFINRQVVIVRTANAMISIVVAIVLFLAINLIASLSLDGTRVDLTENRIFTVSPSTRTVLDAVEEPITLRLFLSSGLLNDFPQLRVYADHVVELLRSFETLSDGRVRVERIDPAPFSTDEDRAIAYGLVGFTLSRAGERGYIGVVGTNALDQVETITALAPAAEAHLEYDLARVVLRLSSPTEPRVAVIDSLGLFGATATGRPPAAVIERIAADFDVVQLLPTVTAIPEDVDTLVVIHPHNLTPSALYAIDQYVIRGGPLLVFLDVLAEHSPPNPQNPVLPQFPSSTLEPLLAAWGVSLVPERVVGNVEMAVEVRAQAGAQIVVIDYPPWLNVGPANYNATDRITDELGLMRISTAGALMPLDGAATTFTPLIMSTAQSMLYEQPVIMRRANPSQLVQMFQSSGVPYTLAARVVGPVSTAFPDGAPPPPATPQGQTAPPAPPELMRQSAKPIRVIVVADTDLLADDVNIDADGTPTTQNADFVVNALDDLTGGGELIALRSRGVSARPFITLDEMEAAAQERYRDTELRLQAELEETEAQLAMLTAQATNPDGQLATLTRQQQEAIADFNDTILDVREELRDVQAALRTDIDALGNRLRLINILAAPILIVVIGLVAAALGRLRLWRHLRQRRRPREAT